MLASTERAIKAPCLKPDGNGDALGLHRPGWRVATGGDLRDVPLRDSQRKLIEEAHAEYLDHLTNAWKGEPKDGGRRRRAMPNKHVLIASSRSSGGLGSAFLSVGPHRSTAAGAARDGARGGCGVVAAPEVCMGLHPASV